MSQSDFAALACDTTFESLGMPAVYVAPGEDQAAVPCRILVDGGEEVFEIEGTRGVNARRLVKVRATEVPLPREGGYYQLADVSGQPIGGVSDRMTIRAAPRREDALRLVWTCEVPR